jgi:hypothetical protein
MTFKVDKGEWGEIVLKEVYNGITFETSEGNQIAVCMRDDTFEINVRPADENRKNGITGKWFRVDMQNEEIEEL